MQIDLFGTPNQTATKPAGIKDVEQALAYTAGVITPYAGQTWIIPQSGGKDSRATAQSMLLLVKRGIVAPPNEVIFMMADTLMEFWTFVTQARQAMDDMVALCAAMDIPARAIVVQPIPQDDYWVRILGYGYAPPSANMRWCTDKLKIQPMNKMRQVLGLAEAPTFLGVRYGESQRRDKILSCTLGGECGPDAMLRTTAIKTKISPIVEWRQCAVWDFLTLWAPQELGISNQGLIDHYGPDGDLRYGCWSCPLIYNDRTAAYLANHNPILHDLIKWTNVHFRRDAAAWDVENREMFLEQDARLSLRYCKELYADLMQIGARHGIQLLTKRQQMEIQAKWLWREQLPEAMAGHDAVIPLGIDTSNSIHAAPLRINQVQTKTADFLAQTKLIDDEYHRRITFAAGAIANAYPHEDFAYHSQTRSETLWHRLPTPIDPNEEFIAVGPDYLRRCNHTTRSEEIIQLATRRRI